MRASNPELIKTADWIVDLGPEGTRGEEWRSHDRDPNDFGGKIVAAGTPEAVAQEAWSGEATTGKAKKDA